MIEKIRNTVPYFNTMTLLIISEKKMMKLFTKKKCKKQFEKSLELKKYSR